MRSLLYGFLAVALLGQNITAAILHGHRKPDISTLLVDHPTELSVGTSKSPERAHFLHARQATPTGALLCNSNLACIDGSCCGNDGICGYGPEFCGEGKCMSNCNAKAMCGKHSEGGAVKCGMNLCCGEAGWCGTAFAHCVGPADWPCQQGFGACEIIPPPSCGPNSGTTNGRTVGYYQSYNVRDRVCMKVRPSDIKTEGYTHLNFAFASVNPASFAVVPADQGDETLMLEFTALKTSTLETWIAVGGYGFSDPGPTHNTWSTLTSNAANRAAFIASLANFMDQYGFQGADLDWEYPVDPKRGGNPSDTANFVLLLREMRAIFGTKYGISMAIAPDYWYLRYFDAKAMEPYVDWFGFMSYDLHGPWDSENALGSIVRGQADVREIYNNTLPLWYAGLNPAKINFGLAYYGRGYTVDRTDCNTLGCGFSGANLPGPCTNYPGIMSLVEIKQLIKDKGLTPNLLPGAMMKELAWGNQWIGYDDEETVAMKKQFANNLCFGGTMAWSVDFNSGDGSGAAPPVTTDGQCGASKGGAICSEEFGKCCSATGWCGSTMSHCGSGCQGTGCATGFVSTDNTCGAANRNSLCGSESSSCCSASGYCGSGAAFCGTGCQSGCNGIQLPVPSGIILVPNPTSTAGWTKVNCLNPGVTNANDDPMFRWNNVYADDAFAEAIQSWKDLIKPIISFPQQISNFFHYAENMQCAETVENNGCTRFFECDDVKTRPAAFMIMNSFTVLNNLLLNFHEATFKARVKIGDAMSQMQKDFAPIPKDDSLVQRLILDGLGLGFILFSAPAFNMAFKKLPIFILHPNGLATTKDTVNGLASSGISFLRTTMAKPDAPTIAGDLKENVIKITELWSKMAKDLQKQIFYGDDKSIEQLKRMFKDGQFMSSPNLLNEDEIHAHLELAMYTWLIPLAWTFTPDHAPFILDSKVDCRKKAHDQAISYSDFPKDKQQASSSCVDNIWYYVASAAGVERDCVPAGQGVGTSCTLRKLSVPPGLEKLGKGQWSQIGRWNLTAAAVKTYTHNENKNGAGYANPIKDVGAITRLSNDQNMAPGVVTLPVCSASEARNNWKFFKMNGKKSSNYPCN